MNPLLLFEKKAYLRQLLPHPRDTDRLADTLAHVNEQGVEQLAAVPLRDDSVGTGKHELGLHVVGPGEVNDGVRETKGLGVFEHRVTMLDTRELV